jgi:dihydroxyacetone kinase-like protein
MALGKEIAPDASNLSIAFASAVEAVKSRGKSQPGQKTMLDVLAPVQVALAEGGTDLSVRLPILAASAADATIPMLATRGRASFLGERSIGHMDPGARSSALIVASVCRALEG